EGELVTDAEYRALTTQKDKALDRWSGYRRDVVTVARTARTVATHRHTKTAARVTARRAAYVRAGARDRRQQRQAERRQDDMRQARRAAVAAGEIDRVQSLDQQIKDRPKQRADAAAARLHVWWTTGLRVGLVLAGLLVLLSVAALINDVAHLAGKDGIAGFGIVPLWSGLASAVAAVVTGIGAVVGFVLAWWALIALGGLLVWVIRLHEHGRSLSDTVLPAALRPEGTTGQVALSESDLVAALGNIGVPGLTQAVKAGWPERNGDRAFVQFPFSDGPGMAAKIRLPHNAPVEAVDKAKVALAHNLGCLPAELRIRKDEDDPTVLDLYKLDKGQLRAPVPQHPLVSEGQTSVFASIPVGVTPFGETLTTPLFERNFVVAGKMGSGKSTHAVGLTVGALLDPVCDVDVFIFAENSDFDA